LLRLHLPLPHYNEPIACVAADDQLFISGTDILRILLFRLRAVGRPVISMKKFEEGVFSDLRNLKPGEGARLEQARSSLLESLYRFGCIRTQKRQKVFYWNSVDHDRLFRDVWEREMRRERDAVDAYKAANPQASLDSHDVPLVEMDDATAETAKASKLDDPLLVTYIRSLEDPVERPWNVLPEARDWFTQELSTKSSRCLTMVSGSPGISNTVAAASPAVVALASTLLSASVHSPTPTAVTASEPRHLITAPLDLPDPSYVTDLCDMSSEPTLLPSVASMIGLFHELPTMAGSSYVMDTAVYQPSPVYLPPILPSWMHPLPSAQRDIEPPRSSDTFTVASTMNFEYATPDDTAVSSFDKSNLMAELEAFLTPPVDTVFHGAEQALSDVAGSTVSANNMSALHHLEPFLTDDLDHTWVNSFEGADSDYYRPSRSPTRSSTPWPVPNRKHDRSLDMELAQDTSSKRPRVSYI